MLVELHGAEDAGVDAIMGREVERSRQYHSEELDALGSWSGEALVRIHPLGCRACHGRESWDGRTHASLASKVVAGSGSA